MNCLIYFNIVKLIFMKQVATNRLSKGVFIAVCTAVMGLSVVPSQAQQIITLQQAIENTMNNNLQVKQSKLSESLSEENLKQAKVAILPSLNASVNQNMGWGRNQVASGLFQNTQNYNLNAGGSSSIDLFNGWSKMNQIRQNKVLVDAGKANTDKVKNDLILQVIISYLDIMYNKDLLLAAEDQLKVSKQTLNQQEVLLEAGNKTLADVSQAKSQVATSELNLTNAQNALTISYLTLAQLMDIPPATKYDIQVVAVDEIKAASRTIDAEQVFQEAIGVFPDIKLAQLNTAASRVGVEVAKANLYPRISLNGSYGTNYFYSYANPSNQTFSEQLKNNISKGVGMGLSIPIFNGLQAKSGVKRARINLMQTETQELLAKNNLNKVIYQAVADLKAAESRYVSTTNAFLAQKDAFYVIDVRYNEGLVNSLDYSTSLTNKNRAEIDMIQAKYDLIFRSKVIDYYLGKQIVF